MESELYGTSTTKRRTKNQLDVIRSRIYAELQKLHPQTLRGVFYVLESAGIVEKSEAGYRMVARLSGSMRLSGELPFQWLADNTRFTLLHDSFNNMVDFLDHAQKLYRRDLLATSEVYIEIWTEKDAIASLLSDAAGHFDVPVFVNRGYPSLTYLYNSAMNIANIGKPCYIYYFGDSDPSGKDIERVTEKRLREFAPSAEIHFERAAVNDDQIRLLNLHTRPPKKSDPRNNNYSGPIVEVDAVRADILQDICMERIAQHISQEKMTRLRMIEAEENQTLNAYFNQIRRFVSEDNHE